MNFIRNQDFRAGSEASLEGFVCLPQGHNQSKSRVFSRSGGANSPIIFLLGASVYAIAIMLLIVSVDKALDPLWNKLISIAEKYDKKWNVKDFR